ncbi:MAG: hypothetical protein LBR79_01045 [Oscillospiraceae bacterium]|jgi:hypothetical protein|nr:hypothetical protein [Oscillospiraceae bacterium]
MAGEKRKEGISTILKHNLIMHIKFEVVDFVFMVNTLEKWAMSQNN